MIGKIGKLASEYARNRRRRADDEDTFGDNLRAMGKLAPAAARNRRRIADDEDSNEFKRALLQGSQVSDRDIESLASKDSVNKQAVMLALLEAMESGGGAPIPEPTTERSSGGAPERSMRPKMNPNRAKSIGSSNSGSTRGIDPRDNYSEDDLKALLRSSGSAKGMMGGGKVKRYENGGAVMAGRGGSFKGTS